MPEIGPGGTLLVLPLTTISQVFFRLSFILSNHLIYPRTGQKCSNVTKILHHSLSLFNLFLLHRSTNRVPTRILKQNSYNAFPLNFIAFKKTKVCKVTWLDLFSLQLKIFTNCRSF